MIKTEIEPALTPQARKAIGISRIMVWMIPAGLILMLISCFEGSWPWAVYVCLTGWWGIVMGLNGSGALKRQVLEPDSAEAKTKGFQRHLWALFMFWIPTLSAVVLGGILQTTLEEAHRPKGVISPLLLGIESLAMYFLAAGFAWIGVYAAQHHREVTQ